MPPGLIREKSGDSGVGHTAVHNKKDRTQRILLILYILIVAAAARFYGYNWDQGNHLHPDERMISMISCELDIPSNLTEYLNPAESPLSPYNHGHTFFVYGTLPITMNKLLVTALDMDTYDQTTIVGRLFSAAIDTMTVLLVFLLAGVMTRLYRLDSWVPFLSAGLYAAAVLPIQLAYFFTVDAFLCFFMTGSVWFAFRFREHMRWQDLCLSAVLFGCAMGTKISAVYCLPLLLWCLILQKTSPFPKHLARVAVRLVVFGLTAYLSLRFTDPRFFADANILNIRMHPIFLENLEMLISVSSPESMYPPAIQWNNTTPVLFALTNLARYGLGHIYFLFTAAGMGLFIAKTVRDTRTGTLSNPDQSLLKRILSRTITKIDRLIIPLWVILFFLYQSTRFVKALRYFNFLYPFFAVFAAIAIAGLRHIGPKWFRLWAPLTAMIAVLIWPISFIGIYTRPHTRVQASRWIHQNIPAESTLAVEHWDDVLPVRVKNVRPRRYTHLEMPVFERDTRRKIRDMQAILNQADYIVLSSNRGYGAIPKKPDQFPYMVEFYSALFAGDTDFEKAVEFTSYPGLDFGFFKWTFPDDDADETFTVYDHPKVMIFQRKTGDSNVR
jgi:hypothetical protein